jgi:formyl-CoA transferase
MLTALGERVTRHGNTHQFFAPVSVYPTRDGYAYVAVGNDRQWQALTGLPGFGSLVEPNYVHNAGRIADVERLNRRMADCTRTMATDELLADLNRIGVPAAKVNAISDVLADPRVCSSLALVCDDRTAIELALAPIAEVNGAARETLSFPPRLGEHNRMIYGEVLGYGAEQLAALKECGAI